MAIPKPQVGNLVFGRIKKRGGYAQHACQVQSRKKGQLVYPEFVAIDPRACNVRINSGLDTQLLLRKLGA